MNLDGVETGLERASRRPCVVGGDSGDVLRRACSCGGDRLRGDESGRREGGMSRGARVRDSACVSDLGAGRRALAVYGVGESAQSAVIGHSPVVTVPIGAALGGGGEIGDGGHADAAAGVFGVEFDELVGDAPAWGAPLERRGFDDAIAQPSRTDRRGREDVGPVMGEGHVIHVDDGSESAAAGPGIGRDVPLLFGGGQNGY